MAVTDLAAQTTSLDAIIDSLYSETGEMAADPAALGYAFGPAGINGLKQVFNAVNGASSSSRGRAALPTD